MEMDWMSGIGRQIETDWNRRSTDGKLSKRQELHFHRFDIKTRIGWQSGITGRI
jgi:hypothetical protein